MCRLFGLHAGAEWVAATFWLPDAPDSLSAQNFSGLDQLDARLEELDAATSVVIASETLDDEPGWRPLASGELIHVANDLTVTSWRPFPEVLSHPMTLQDLAPVAATSQHPAR